MMKYLLFLFFISFFFTQEKSTRLQVTQFSHNMNLSQSTVTAILQDRFDYIWIGTQNGLNKFDGNKIVQFYKNENKNYSISDNNILAFFEENINRVWIGSRSGIDLMDRENNSLSAVPLIDGSEISSINSIVKINDKIIICGAEGFYSYSEKDHAFEYIKELESFAKNNTIQKMISYKNNSLIVMIDNDVYEINSNFELSKLVSSSTALNDIQLSQNKLYIASHDGLFIYDFESSKTDFKRPNGHFSTYFQSLEMSPDGELFIGTQNALIKYDPVSDKFSLVILVLNNIEINDVIMNMYFDNDGSLWIGTLTQGLLYYRKRIQNFELYITDLTNPITKHSNVRAFVRFKDQIIFSSFESGFGSFDLQKKQIVENHRYLKLDKIAQNFINTLYNENDNRLWVGKYQGLTIIDFTNGKFKEILKVDDEELINIWKIHKLSDSELLVGSSIGLSIVNTENFTIRKFPLVTDREANFNVFDIKKDKNNILWIGSDIGLIKHNLTSGLTEVFKYEANNLRSISDNFVKTIHIDQNYQIWIGTRNGLDKFYPLLNEFKRFSTRDGLPNNVIYGILENDNKLWVSTNNGIAKIDKETLSIYCYDKSDGLQGVEFNTGSYYQDSDYFYFGGINGFNRFNPSTIVDLNVYKKPVITDILINNNSILYHNSDIISKDINLIKEVTLDYNDKIISFEVSLIDFLHLNKRKYQFRMENFKDEWLNNDTRNLVSFTNLEPGEYTFSVRASTMNLFDSSVQEDLKIIIKPPIWNHWLFQLFFALIILAVVYGAHLNRIYHIRRENEILENANKQLMEQIDQRIKAENERKDLEVQLQHAHKLETIGTLAGGIAHDFNNLLTPLVGYSELLKTEFDEDHPYYKMLNNIYMAALRGRDLVQQILVFSREINIDKKSIRFSQIINETITLLRPTIPKSVEMTYTEKSETDYIYASPTQLHQVVMNLCTNALQAMKDETGYIHLELEDIDEKPSELNPEKDYVAFKISDSGSGIPKDIQDRIFDPFFTTKDVSKGTGLGLSVVHGIIKNHEGKISVSSVEGKGTVFTIILPKFNKKAVQELDQSFIREGNEHVVVIDDEEMILDFLEKILIRYGYKVKTFIDSEKGYNYIDNHIDEIDLLISDQTMPQLTGVQMVQKIREKKSKLPIIIMTGYSEIVKKDNYHELGIDYLIMKPLTMLHIFEAIDAVLKKS